MGMRNYKEMSTFNEVYYLMASSFDSTISFWEFRQQDLPHNLSKCLRISRNLLVTNPKAILQNEGHFFFIKDLKAYKFEPACQHKVSHEGIGHIELVKEHLMASCMNGAITVWTIENPETKTTV